MSGTVTQLVLVNADTDRDLMPLTAGAQLNLATLPTRKLNVRADVSGTVGSVRFALDAASNYKTENGAPYAIAGNEGADYLAWTPTVGPHTLKATPFANDNAAGTVGTALSVGFTVVDQPVSVAPPAAPTGLTATAVSATHVNLAWNDVANEGGYYVDRSTDGTSFNRIATVAAGVTSHSDTGLAANVRYSYRVLAYNGGGTSPASTTAAATTPVAPSVTVLTLVNADTDQDLFALTDGVTLNLATLPTRNLNVRADVGTGTASVRFGLDGNANFRVETSAPLALAGDAGGGDYNAWTPSVGAHTLTVTPYSAAGATGAAGAAVVVSFTVTDVATPNPNPNPTPALVGPPQASVDKAIAAPLIRYDRTISGGAHTNGAIFGGASITLAVAAYTGNTSADARLLQQMRYTITGNNDITANGGYPAQHELHVTGMYAIAKQTPRVWNQLTTVERQKIDLLMKAALVGSAFTTSDNNPYIKAGTQQYAIDGDSNLSRSWNPNYREGMAGAMLVSTVYFGGGAAADQILNTYDHAQFVADLKAAGLTNLHETFNWKTANPTSKAPTGATIEAAVRNYRYYSLTLSDPMGIYGRLVTDTYGKTVNAGLNNGAGISGGGKIVSGASTLPNKGVVGMLKEFDSNDAGGARSSAHYAYDGFRSNQTNQLVLIIGGAWQRDSAIARDAVTRLKVGNTDLWYKLDKGYVDYFKGAVRGTYYSTATGRAYEFTRPMWDSVLTPYHGV